VHVKVMFYTVPNFFAKIFCSVLFGPFLLSEEAILCFLTVLLVLYRWKFLTHRLPSLLSSSCCVFNYLLLVIVVKSG